MKYYSVLFHICSFFCVGALGFAFFYAVFNELDSAAFSLGLALLFALLCVPTGKLSEPESWSGYLS